MSYMTTEIIRTHVSGYIIELPTEDGGFITKFWQDNGDEYHMMPEPVDDGTDPRDYVIGSRRNAMES